MFVHKAGSLNVWSGITENAKVLGEGMKMAVGNGASTLFWDHKWVANNPLSDYVTQPVPMELAGATVEEMWEHKNGRKWDIFSPFLPSETLKLIQAFELRNDPSIGDLVYWKNGPKGRFSIKYAIHIMQHINNPHDDICWDLIWKSPTQQRVRAFLWLACHDRILGNLNRFKRHMTKHPRCFICGETEESSIHILRDCTAARLVWRKIGGYASKPEFWVGNIKDWITANIDRKQALKNEKWPTQFSIVLWWLWRWRYFFVFGRQNEIPVDIEAFPTSAFYRSNKQSGGCSGGEYEKF